jgi:hypothetical protein
MDSFNGNWSRRGLIHVPVIPAPTPGRPPKPIVGEWTDTRLREAHRRFHNGSRDLLTLEGERVYQARRKRAQRAGAMNPTDRLWAERNATKSSWRQFERDNRLMR